MMRDQFTCFASRPRESAARYFAHVRVGHYLDVSVIIQRGIRHRLPLLAIAEAQIRRHSLPHDAFL